MVFFFILISSQFISQTHKRLNNYACFNIAPPPPPQSQKQGMCASVDEGDAVAQSIERATPAEEVLGSIGAVAARSLLVGSV